jgi:hypothetical protein
MQIKQSLIINSGGFNAEPFEDANLVLVFGDRFLLDKPGIYDNFKKAYPQAPVVFCSTSGEIQGTEVYDDTIAVTAIAFKKTKVKAAIVNIKDFTGSLEAGAHLLKLLAAPDLKHVLVMADGGLVNGSDLVQGMNSAAPAGVSVSGGLAGDAARFEKTLVGLNEQIGTGNMVAIGLYGNSLLVGHGSNGGWDPFGPYRTITKSRANVLYELEGKPALELYKQYLGQQAAGLPGTALLFPLSLITAEDSEPVVRTILAVNEADGSMTFAGNMPEGAKARLMQANFDKLIDAASGAAANSFTPFKTHQPALAILVSCVGRKLVLNQRVFEEVESVQQVLGAGTALTGFYSYGEISPLLKSNGCALHNQTMTITTLTEI